MAFPPLDRTLSNKYVLNRPEHEKNVIIEYFESQSSEDGEKVAYLEKVATERLFDRDLDAWDVHTDRGRWWVITSPTNLYSQELFPSLDYTISFHIGLTTRIMAQRQGTATDEQQDRLAVAWRRWTQAAEALDRADEVEEFQAVGMRCRVCLLAMAHAIANSTMVPEGQEPPKRDDFKHWSGLIAQTIAHGSSAEKIRAYLKAVAESTWDLVSRLTHASNVARFDGHMAVDATQNVLAAFGAAWVRYEHGTPDRCPHCSSYRLISAYRPDLDIDPPYITLCESCGWGTPEGDTVPESE